MDNSCLAISVHRVGDPFLFSMTRIGKGINVGVRRRGEAMSFRCGLVCTSGSKFYLEVPNESIWLLPENGFSHDVVVYANVAWTIE